VIITLTKFVLSSYTSNTNTSWLLYKTLH